MARRRKDPTEALLDALRAALGGTPEARDAAIRDALDRGGGVAVARAAAVARDEALLQHEDALVACWHRLVAGGREVDAGCGGKLAVVEALDALEHLRPEPFEEGVVLRQYEPSWGPPEESAGSVRARCGAALVRVQATGALPALADLLADDNPTARIGGIQAVAQLGGPGAAALLRLKLRVGDAEPGVVSAVMAGLLALERDDGVALVASFLDPPRRERRGPTPADAERRELAIFALGESRLDAAVDPLVAALDAAVLRADQRPLLTALAVHRTERSRRALFDRVASGSADIARGAVAALRIQRFDPSTERLAREAAARNADVDLNDALDDAFRE